MKSMIPCEKCSFQAPIKALMNWHLVQFHEGIEGFKTIFTDFTKITFMTNIQMENIFVHIVISQQSQGKDY